MKRHLIRPLSASALLLSFSTYAHNPSEHLKEGQKTDCSILQKMDHSKMNMSDPVMQAITKKCVKGVHGDSTQTEKDAVARNIPKSEAK